MVQEEMNNPYEQVQINILQRIVKNAERLNQSVVTLNQALFEINRKNKNLEIMGQICENYQNNIQFNLEASGTKQPPL